MSSPGSAPAWVPTHVQVTVLRARGLRSKAAAGGGGSDAYTVMALGRDKFSTSVAERCQGQPLWREEATFELPPPPRPATLRLTVLHRALVGLDKFLGRAEVDLAALRAEGGRRHSRWYKLRSKPGKKEKERGELEVDIQFMRSSMTASMFDLSSKEKARSPLGKLKEKLKGRRSSGLSDTASAIVPSSAADSDDEAAERDKKKSKLKSLFSKPGLQKSSLSQSMSVLPTQQPVTHRVRLHPSDFQPQWDEEEPEASPTSEKAFGNSLEGKSSPSPVFRSRKTATLDRQLNQVTTTHPRKEGLSLFSGLKSKGDPVSKSSLCINGSHVYMEESTTKDNTPASSPSPLNFRRKQLFASEENLSSRATKGPEETGRTSPSHAFSGSASLETFKSMTLPSYKLLSSEEHLESSIPPSAEVIKETKKPDHRKSALLSLVSGKKEAVKTSDAESIADRTLQEEESTALEERSEQEANHLELPADVSRGTPSEGSQQAGDVLASKQSLNPFEEGWKPDKAAAPVKSKAVKPRLGLPSEEESKATLPTLAPDAPPAALSVHPISSDNNPFVPKLGQKGADPEPTTGSPASPPSPAAAELFTGRNPFSPEWGRAPPALDPQSFAHFPSSPHLTASVPRAPCPGQVSGAANNPFASGWGQSSQGQGLQGSDTSAPWGLSHPLPPSLPSDCHFNGSNPFVSRPGWEADVAGFKAVAGSPPLCLPCDEECCSAEQPAELGHPAHPAAGLPLTGGVQAAADPPITPDSPGLPPEQQGESPQLQAETPLGRSMLGSGSSVFSLLAGPEGATPGHEGLGGQEDEEQGSGVRGVLLGGSEAAGEQAGFAPKLEAGCCPSPNPSGDSIGAMQERESASPDPCPPDSSKHSASLCKCSSGLLPGMAAEAPSSERELEEKQEVAGEKRPEERVPPVEPQEPPLEKSGSFSQAGAAKAALGAGSEVLVPPEPAAGLSAVLERLPPVSQAAEFCGDDPCPAGGVRPAPGPLPPDGKASGAGGCLPQSGSLAAVSPPGTLRDSKSSRHVTQEGDSSFFESLRDLRAATPVAGLPVILEGGSDDELLGDCQESSGLAVAGTDVSGRGKQSLGVMPLHSDSSAAAQVTLAAPGGGAGGVCEAGQAPELSARAAVHSAREQAAASGSAQRPQSREPSGHLEKQELQVRAGVECELSEPSVSSCPLSSPSQPCSCSPPVPPGSPSPGAESRHKPAAEGSAAAAAKPGKKRLLQAWVSPSEAVPSLRQQSGGSVSPKHRLHPVKPMNATANKPQSKSLNVISTMNEKLLEMNMKRYDPSDPAYAYAQLTHDELIQLVLRQKDTITRKDLQVRELEDYIDNLLVRVMEETPNILRVATSANRKAGKM